MPIDHAVKAQDTRAHPYGVEFFGPLWRDSYDVLLDGRIVPYLTMSAVNNRPGDDMWHVCLDRRFGSEEATGPEVRKWIWFIVNAMAVSAGYVRFGADDRRNPFNAPVYIDDSMAAVERICEPADQEDVLYDSTNYERVVLSIPYLKMYRLPDDPEGSRILFLDGRWAMKATEAECNQWVNFLANAMAIAAGYTSFANDNRINLFKGATVIELSSGEMDDLTVGTPAERN